MACHIAEKRPLSLLRSHLGLAAQCHSFRTTCSLSRGAPSGAGALGAPGAVLGYCQALFAYAGSPREHTARVRAALQGIHAPWSSSHELYWGFRGTESALDFVREGMEPLLGTGRVPVLITALDRSQD